MSHQSQPAASVGSSWCSLRARARVLALLAVGAVVMAPAPVASQIAHARAREDAREDARLREHARTSTPPAINSDQPASDQLDSLILAALARSPAVRAAAARVEAVRMRVAPAGARPDPMLMAGIQNLPATRIGVRDGMTMQMVGLSQMIPYPGKRQLSRTAAERDVSAAEAELERTRTLVVRDATVAYYELVYVDRTHELLTRSHQALLGIAAAVEMQYASGRAEQPDVLRAQVVAAQLGERAATLIARRSSALARFNAVLGRPHSAPIDAPEFPARVLRAAVATSARAVRFESTALGASAADSPLPDLATLQQLALRSSPELRAQTERLTAQAARVELARKAHLPDVDVAVSYGQRFGDRDMISATVSVPLPVQRATRQESLLASEQAELANMDAMREQLVNTLEADVAARVADVDRARSHLALYTLAVLPPARAAFDASLAGFEAGRSDFTRVLAAQQDLFDYESASVRALTDFASAVAELEQLIGTEVLP